jgi:hypothetical protein
VLYDFRQKFSPALIKRLEYTFLRPIFQGVNQSQPITPSTADWLIASSVIIEEIRWAVNAVLVPIKQLVRTEFFLASY